MKNETTKAPTPHPQTNYTNARGNHGRNASTRERSVVSWGDVDAERLRACVQRITNNGCALIVGKTSDGGAFSLTLLAGNERVREYAHSVAELTAILDWLSIEYGTSASGAGDE